MMISYDIYAVEKRNVENTALAEDTLSKFRAEAQFSVQFFQRHKWRCYSFSATYNLMVFL